MIEPPIPRIVPRSEHSLSRQNIDPEALKVLYRLWDHGFVSYLVGGCVRDLLLGKTPKDFDVATDAHPQQIKEGFRNSRLIGRRFRIAHVFFRGGNYIEVSTFRRKSEFEEEEENPHPQGENTFGTPAEDALRRDITINGIFYNPRDFSLIDYVGGLEDLQNGIIRCIGDPDEKFHQDPVRMIRVVRHAARTRFRIEDETYQALLRHVAELDLCSRSRVRDEFLRDLCEGSAEASLRLMLKTGMLRAIFPTLNHLSEDAVPEEFFFNTLKAIDARSAAENPFPSEFSLTVFLLPFLFASVPWEDLPPGRRGTALFRERVREWIGKVFGPLQVTHRAKEIAIDLLSAQRIFQEFLPSQRLPWHFMSKSFFPGARQLFEIGYRASGEDPGSIVWQIEEKTSEKRRKRKRWRKRPKPQTPPPPNP
ncbi:MAG: polynucleotide adenylyltransferase PcnB [Deltaproteobacteria bacterium]|nr:MAG: polynucleotide adenylyltransferase PcnB [Deltaproteobacteria bacterium]